jgi:hypothetical protein
MAIDGNRSSFKADENYTIDTFIEMFELSQSDVENVEAWKALKRNGGTDTEDFRRLQEELSNKIITSEIWNKLCDCMVNLEKLYVDKGLNEIDDTVKEYVEEYAEQDINDKLGTTINNLLLTNATEVIISSTTPTVKNGAVWFKPKTT